MYVTWEKGEKEINNLRQNTASHNPLPGPDERVAPALPPTNLQVRRPTRCEPPPVRARHRPAPLPLRHPALVPPPAARVTAGRGHGEGVGGGASGGCGWGRGQRGPVWIRLPPRGGGQEGRVVCDGPRGRGGGGGGGGEHPGAVAARLLGLLLRRDVQEGGLVVVIVVGVVGRYR